MYKIVNEDDKYKYIYLVYCNGSIVRLCICKITNTMYIDNLITDSKVRRKGYATKLMLKAETIARDNNCNIMSLYTKVDSWMKTWYNNLGFIDYSIDGEDIYMIKKIN